MKRLNSWMHRNSNLLSIIFPLILLLFIVLAIGLLIGLGIGSSCEQLVTNGGE